MVERTAIFIFLAATGDEFRERKWILSMGSSEQAYLQLQMIESLFRDKFDLSAFWLIYQIPHYN